MIEAAFDSRVRDTAADAARTLLAAQYALLEAALGKVRTGSDPDALHDLRVALRRSRTVLSQLGEALGENESAALRAELAWLMRATGPVRDLDVYLAHLPEHAAALPPALRHALEPLHAFACQRREIARVELMQVLGSARTAEVFAAWRRLARQAMPQAHAEAGADAAAVTGARIARRYDKLLAQRERLRDEVTPQRLHDLRKSGKKMRYLLDLLSGIEPSREADALVKRLEQLQDALGRHHDLHVHGELTLTLVEELAAAGGAGPRTLAAGGAVAQVMLAEERRSVRECLHALERMLRQKVRRRVARISPGAAVRPA